MKLSQICKTEILKPFTVQEFFEENFYVSVNIFSEKENVIKILFPENCGIYSFLNKEEKKFYMEKIDDTDNERGKEYFEENVFSKYMIMTVRYNEGCEGVCEGALGKNDGKVLLCAYIYKLFKKIIQEYQAYPVCFLMHQNEDGNDEDVYSHFHLCFAIDEGEEKLEKDFSPFIESDEETRIEEEENEDSESEGN